MALQPGCSHGGLPTGMLFPLLRPSQGHDNAVDDAVDCGRQSKFQFGPGRISPREESRLRDEMWPVRAEEVMSRVSAAVFRVF
jgi:hypothetical protein